jgi:hypothetical protein
MRHLKATCTTLVLAAATALTAAASTTEGAKSPEASIPFVNAGSSIRNWQADGEQGLWVQDAHRQWYYARLMSTCHGLDFALRIGFETRGIDNLDRFASVIVPGHGRCPIESFTKSNAPGKDGAAGAGESAPS